MTQDTTWVKCWLITNNDFEYNTYVRVHVYSLQYPAVNRFTIGSGQIHPHYTKQ